MRRCVSWGECQRFTIGLFGFGYISRTAVGVGEIEEIMWRRALLNRGLGQCNCLLMLLRLPGHDAEQQQRIGIARTLLEGLLIAPGGSAEVACSVALQSLGE